MNSFTGKFSSVRGWALLLALLLGAGMFIPACGDEEVPAPTTPEPAPTPPTPPPEPEPTGPATPENLRVSAVTSSSITWMWDAVEGVIGYQGQFSTDSTFADTDPTFLIVAPNTSHTVSNLAGSTTGHFRVRSGTGTSLTDLQYSEWTDGVSGATDAAPAATALAAPDNLETSEEEEDSIVLTWDEVDGATTYEVQQRDEDATSYSPASCDDAGSVVDETSCTLTGLDSGTDYDFRVRGIPAADDTANAVGEWGTTSGSTTGRRQTTTTTPGGMGELMVRWHNGGTNNATITFVWDRQGEAMYETHILTDPADIHKDNPCANVADVGSSDTPAYMSRGSATSQDVSTTGADEGPGTVRGICVREENSSEASFAWGISPAEEPDNGTPDVEDDEETVELTWTGVDLKEAFDYEIVLAADPERPRADNKIDADAKINSRAVQAACDAGREIDSFTPDINLTGRTVSVDSGLKPHIGYLLCIRASNGAGIGTWSVPISNDADNAYSSADDGLAQEIYTRPAAPPRGGSPDIESVDATTTENEKLAPTWEIGTRSVSDVPRESTQFTTVVFSQDADKPDADAVKVDSCGTTAPTDYTLVTHTKIDGLSGFEVSVAAADGIEREAFTRRVYMCAQADSNGATADADKGAGPWTLTGPYSVTKPSGLSGTIGFTRTKVDGSPVTYDVDVTLTIKNWNKNWSYSIQEGDAEPTCTSGQTTGADSTGEVELDWNGLALSTKRTVEVFADDSCTTSLRKSTYTVPSS